MERSSPAKMLVVMVLALSSTSVSRVAAQTIPSDLTISVSLTPSNAMATIGNSITLTCTAVLSANVSGAIINFEYGFVNQTVTANADTTQTDMADIPPVTLSSTTEYTCIVTVMATGECGGGELESDCPTMTSNPVTLVVTFPSDLITSVSLSPATLTGTVGSSIGLMCTAKLSMDVTAATIVFNYWLGDTSVATDSGTTLIDTATISVSLSSAGDYTCTVTVTATDVCGGTAPACPTLTSDPVTMTVRFPDNLITSVSLSPPSPTGTVGSSVDLMCTAELSVLSVDVTGATIGFKYMLGGTSVDTNSGTTLTDTATISVSLSSAGDYTCTVTVTAADVCGGTAPACPTLTSDPVTMTVQFPDNLITSVSLSPAPLTGTVGSSVDLICAAELSVDVTGATIGFNYMLGGTSVDTNSGTTLTDTATISVSISSAGGYTCTVTVTAAGVCGGTAPACPTLTSDPVTMTVQFPSDLITSVSLSPATPTGTVGSPINLMCTAKLSVDITEATIGFNYRLGGTSVATNSGTTLTDTAAISVSLSSAGDYTCTVTITATDVCEAIPNCPTMTSDSVTLTVQFPSNLITSVSLEIMNPTGIVGSSIALMCTAMLSVDVSGAEIEFDYGLDGTSMATVSDTTETNTATISPVAISSAGNYACAVTVTAPDVCGGGGSEPICPTMTSGPVSVAVLSITPTSLTRLDISPYNEFNLYCSLSVPTGNLFSYSWTENLIEIPGTTGLSVSETNEESNSSTVTSVLSVTLKAVPSGATPTYNYVCTGGITGSNTVDVSSAVSVKGSAPPNKPQLGMVNALPKVAIIHFTVTSVAYDPENYTVIYGTSEDALTTVSNASNMTDSSVITFLTDNTLMYTITVDGLNISQEYYYLIQATNSNSSVNSTIGDFTTAETPPSPPANLILRIDTATSLYLSWEEPAQPNGNITQYNYICYTTSDKNMVIQTQTEFDPSTRSVIITGTNGGLGIAPYTNYTCEVTAFTGAGEGLPATMTATSAQAAPEGPPVNLAAGSTDPTILFLSWSLPEESLRNGVITHYEYMCVDVHSGPQNTAKLNASVMGLTPFTSYSCSVKAATVNSTGPAASIIGTTAEDIPGPVNSLSVIGENSTSFLISWTSPTSSEKNGIISSYYLVATFTSNDSFVRDMRLNVNETVLETTYVHTLPFSGLVKYIPYNVTVFAATSAGNGTEVTDTGFTEQGTPGKVTIESTTRINATHMTVTWTPLTLEQARGFVTIYIVRATPDDSSRKRQNAEEVSKEFPSNVTSGTLTTLQKGVTYSVTVTASTKEGVGETSDIMTVTPVSGGINTLALVVIICAVVTAAILVVIIILLYICYRSQRTAKLHTLTVEANPLVVKDVTNGTKNGTSIELKGMEKTEESDRYSQPIPVDRFATHVAGLHARRDLGFEEEYLAFKGLPQGAYMVSKLPHNTGKNRFENVFPFDNARVELTPTNGKLGSDYINASWMDGYRKEKAYIAAQGPLEHTVVDFWRMIWEFQLPTVIMLTELVERAIEKCSCYWPKSMNQTMEVGMGLKVTLVEQRAYVEYKLKRIILFNSSEKDGGKLEVTHYHFTAWPDHGVPADKTCMLAFIKRIRKAHPPTSPPLLVHCSAGVGRTGTFITLDTMLQRMEDGQDLNIFQFVKQMRTNRVLMVQTEAQYTYIHDAMAEYITCGDTSIEATTASVFKRMEKLEKVTDHKTGYQRQFELLSEISIKVTDGLCSEALQTSNMQKNRYQQSLSSLPFNYNRVRLKTMTGSGDYINASVVDGYKHRGAFLATQAPLEGTANDFWRMVWENQSMAIVMLYDIKETSDSDERKFCQYWPPNPGDEREYGKVLVKLVSEKEQAHYTLRKMELRMESTYINLASGGDKSDTFTVTQYQYRKWPETGKPPEPLHVLRLIDNLIKTQSNTGNKAITVMCSDGIGRTGAFICIYSVLERVKTEAVADIFQFIKSSRFQRAGLVKELDQYVFCHEMLQEFLSTFDNYSNFEVKR